MGLKVGLPDSMQATPVSSVSETLALRVEASHT